MNDTVNKAGCLTEQLSRGPSSRSNLSLIPASWDRPRIPSLILQFSRSSEGVSESLPSPLWDVSLITVKCHASSFGSLIIARRLNGSSMDNNATSNRALSHPISRLGGSMNNQTSSKVQSLMGTSSWGQSLLEDLADNFSKGIKSAIKTH
mmetsp:Transcript_31797/g.57551  ORF Transcript_31797/g.57551 Transcript_31797/m.57551 type:complete len:150 (+) Transcript_31797:754-1203(+)